TETTVERFDFKILFIIIGSVVLFGLLLRPLGLYLSIFLLVAGSSIASFEFNWRVAVVNAIFLVVFCWLAFVKGLGLIFPLWPTFLGMNENQGEDNIMELLEHLALGFSVAITPENLLYALLGCILGTLVGVLPGLGPVPTIAMLLPITYVLPPVAGLIMLAGIYYGTQY